MVTEEAMVEAAWLGAILSLAVAFFTLLFFTRNIILAALCLASIASIVIITLGIMPIVGWRFGFLEAMCMVFVVGFSVDFVAHLATAYDESHLRLRELRTTQALASMGVSIFWGTATTIAASFFLVFCVMVPFSKTGIFLMWNQLVSFTFAVLPFSASLMLLGPSGERGRLRLPEFCRPKGSPTATTENSASMPQEVFVVGSPRQPAADSNPTVTGYPVADPGFPVADPEKLGDKSDPAYALKPGDKCDPATAQLWLTGH